VQCSGQANAGDSESMANGLAQIDETPVSLSESQALVERISRSAELRRAARLRAFLLYVCDRTLNQGAAVIHEQEIGTAVFERSAGYDTSIDNIVRVNATELRKRLEHYFVEEGSAEDVTVEIQRGSYTPIFRRRANTALLTEHTDHAVPQMQTAGILPKDRAREESIQPDTVARPLSSRRDQATTRRFNLWKITALAFMLGCGWLGWQLHVITPKIEPWKQQPALRTFWGDFFDSGTGTDIVLADTSFALAEDMMQRPVSLTDYLDYKYKEFAEDPKLSDDQRRDLTMVLERNNGSIADFRAGQEILALSPSDPSRLAMKFAREYTAEAAKKNSLVLIGSRQSNPWVSLFADKLNFDLAYDAVLRRAYVVNRASRPGEAALYPAASKPDNAGTGYAVIAYLPGLSPQTRTLIIEGSDSQATGAAGDFVTSEASMQQLEQKLGGGKVPYFEALIRTAQLSGTPLRGEVIAFRNYSAHN
jgi:hypothetical protein